MIETDSKHDYMVAVSTLVEIEEVARALSAEEREELLVAVATSLREEKCALPPPRKFSSEQIQQWIADDEVGMAEFLAVPPNQSLR